MAIKHTIAALVEVPGPMREFYVKQDDGSFALDIEGHPLVAKVNEFRKTNVALMDERKALAEKVAAFEGIDVAAAKAALAKAASGEADAADVAKLRADLAQAQSAHATAQQKADELVFRQAISSAFIAAGGRPEAVEYMTGKAPFVLGADGALQPKPGEAAPTVEEWLKDQMAGAGAFAFLPSTGGGAIGGKSSVLGAHTTATQLVNPTPQQLGEHSKEITSGKMKVVYTT